MPPVSGIETGSGATGLDFANYFVSYGYLYHQKDMLQDRGRMDAYRNAILQNTQCFKDKVVLDVGTGSGVLAIWAGMAGAKKVYAVEATSMAQHARRLVQQNGMQDVVTVLEGYMEKIELPEKVDVILSEWMGYFLLREAMFDSVLNARDAWLKPGGALFPSHASLRMAPLNSILYHSRLQEYNEEIGACRTCAERARAATRVAPPCARGRAHSRTLTAARSQPHAHSRRPHSRTLIAARARVLAHPLPHTLLWPRPFASHAEAWQGFGEWMSSGNGINVSGLTEFFAREQHEYLLQSAQWCQLKKAEVIGDEFAVTEFDMATTTIEELKACAADFRCVISDDAELNAFGGWFDTDFRGSPADPAPTPITLTTEPESATHWAQQVFMVHPPMSVQVGDTLEGTVKCQRQRLNHRLMWVQLTLTLNRAGVGQVGPERTLNYRID